MFSTSSLMVMASSDRIAVISSLFLASFKVNRAGLRALAKIILIALEAAL
jgi:hypothetical protein